MYSNPWPLVFKLLFVLCGMVMVLLASQLRELGNHEKAALPGLILRKAVPREARASSLAAEAETLGARRVTDQVCYLPKDETELCEFNNVICWDGEGPVVVTPEPIRPLPEEWELTRTFADSRVGDGQTKCMDFAALEPSAPEFSRCNLALAGSRMYAIPDDYTGVPSLDHSVPLGRRRWGPLGRGDSLLFREVR